VRAGPFADVDLVQVLARLHGQARGVGDGVGGLLGAVDRAGVDRREVLALEPAAERLEASGRAFGHLDAAHAADLHTALQRVRHGGGRGGRVVVKAAAQSD
jgi:hypothetical protein